MEERRRENDKTLDRLESKIDKLVSVQSDMHSKQEVIKSKVERIETETIKTNGRVTKVEAWQNTKNGELRIICWIVGVFVAAVIGAWVKILI